MLNNQCWEDADTHGVSPVPHEGVLQALSHRDPVTKAIEHGPSGGTLGDLASSMASPNKGKRVVTLVVGYSAHVSTGNTLCPPYSRRGGFP